MYHNIVLEDRRVFPRTLLKPKSWRFHIHLIHELFLSKKIVTAVIGDAFSGKTSFGMMLCESSQPFFKTILLDAAKYPDEIAFKQALASGFLQEEPETLSQLIEDLRQHESTLFCIIDNAHVLQEDTLECLLSYSHQDVHRSAFHFCLLALPTIQPRLRALEKKSLAHRLHAISLGKWTIDEVKTYLLQLCQGQHWFLKKNLEIFYQMTDGELSKVNACCDALIQFSPSTMGYFSRSFKRLRQKTVRYCLMIQEKFGFYQITLSFLMMVTVLVFALMRGEGKVTLSPSIASLEPCSIPASILLPLAIHAKKEALAPPPFKRSLAIQEAAQEEDLGAFVVRDRVLIVPKAMYRRRLG